MAALNLPTGCAPCSRKWVCNMDMCHWITCRAFNQPGDR